MKSNNLIAIDLEIASTCNAACPVCIRRQSGEVADFEQQMRTLEDVKRIYFTVFESIKSFACFTLISSLLTIKKSNL